MRNLKRALSLALAFVMVMSMMVVGAGAVSIDDFSDKDQIVNTEAVMTMVSLGVINGKDDGSYDPTGIVTRAEMAKLISVTLNGGKDPTLGAITANFTDTKGHWAESYIAYVASLGIVDGRGDGTFGPNDQVTGAQAAKMILTMLGYRSDIEGFTGANWAINVQLKGNDIDLFDGLSINPDEGLTRDETAQMLYNAVQADMVEYRNLEGSYDGIVYPQPLNGVDNDSTVLWEKFKVQKVEGVVVANDIMAIDNRGTTVAGKARLRDIYVGGTHRVDTNGVLLEDVYPVSLDNSYLGQRVVLYVKGLKNLAPNAASTEVVGLPIISQDNTVASTTKRLKDTDAVRSFLSENSLSLPADGVASTVVNGTVTYTDNDTEYGATPSRDFAVTSASNVNGTRLTFIDHNGDGVVDYIFKTLPKMAKVTVYSETDKALTIAGEGSIEFSDIANEADVAKDDIVLYYIMNETYYLEKAETVSGKVESYNDNNKTVVIDGTSYGKSTVQVETSGTDLEEYGIEMPMVGNTYTFYLDNNGNVVAWILGEESVGNYALVLSSDDSGSAVVTKGEVKLLLADGSVVTGNVNLLASANKFADTKDKGSTEAKESAMAAKLADNKMANTLVTYVIGEDKTITIGDPTTVSKQFYNIAAGSTYAAPTQPVQRSTASYTFTPVAKATASNVTVSVNDSTLFFIRNVGGTGYSVVKGVSNLPTTALKKADGSAATVNSVIYTNTSANPMLAKAVFVEADYQGTASYLYVTASYTGTLSVNGEQVYTYPVVFEDGTEGTVNADGSSYDDGLVYEYTVDSNGVAHLDSTVAPSNGKSGVVNGYVSTFAKGQNITLANGENPADTRSYTVLTNANLWNEEGKPYKETLTSDMTVALVIDADGFVKTAFVKDTSVTKGNVAVDSSKDAALKNVSIVSNTVFSGFDAQFKGFAANTKVTYSYSVLMNNSKTETYTNKTATTDKDGILTISMPKNATTLTLTAANNVTGGGETPTGDYTITAYTGQWTSGYNFYVNGTKVTSFTEGVGTKSFTVKNTDTVAIDGFTFGSSVNNNATVTLADGVTGTVNKAAGSVTFKVSSNVTLSDPTTIAGTATGGDEPVVTPAIDSNITVVVEAKDDSTNAAVEGVTVTKAQVTGTAGSEVLNVEVKMPDGYSAVSDIEVHSIINNVDTTMTDSYSGPTNAWASTASAQAAAVKAASAVTLKVIVELTANTTADVSYTGATVSSPKTTLNLKGQTAENLGFTVTGLDSFAKEVKVTYKLTGTTKDGTYSVLTANGAIVGNEAANSTAGTTGAPGAINATGPVTVEIVSVETTKVGYEVKFAEGVTGYKQSGTISAAATIGTAGTLADFAVDAASGTLVAGTKATIKFTVTGIEGGPKTFTTEDVTVSSNKYSVAAGVMDGAAMPSITADGTGNVVITIDAVTLKSVKATFTQAITGASSGEKVNACTEIASAGSNSDVALQADGSLKVTLKLTDSAGSTHPAAGTYAVYVDGVEAGKVVVAGTEGAAVDLVVTVKAPSDTATYNFTVIKIG